MGAGVVHVANIVGVDEAAGIVKLGDVAASLFVVIGYPIAVSGGVPWGVVSMHAREVMSRVNIERMILVCRSRGCVQGVQVRCNWRTENFLDRGMIMLGSFEVVLKLYPSLPVGNCVRMGTTRI